MAATLDRIRCGIERCSPEGNRRICREYSSLIFYFKTFFGDRSVLFKFNGSEYTSRSESLTSSNSEVYIGSNEQLYRPNPSPIHQL